MIFALLFQDAEKFDEGGVNLTVCLSNDPSCEFHWNHITGEHLAKKVMDVMRDSKDPRVQLAFNQYRPSGIVRLEYSGKQRIPIIGVIGEKCPVSTRNEAELRLKMVKKEEMENTNEINPDPGLTNPNMVSNTRIKKLKLA